MESTFEVGLDGGDGGGGGGEAYKRRKGTVDRSGGECNVKKVTKSTK